MRRLLAGLGLVAALAGCGGGADNQANNSADVDAEEGIDPNMMIGGDEISPIPEAEDDMAANQAAGGGNVTGNGAQTAPPPAPGPMPPQPQPR
jgi:hypothetical protein